MENIFKGFNFLTKIFFQKVTENEAQTIEPLIVTSILSVFHAAVHLYFLVCSPTKCKLSLSPDNYSIVGASDSLSAPLLSLQLPPASAKTLVFTVFLFTLKISHFNAGSIPCSTSLQFLLLT